MFRDRTWLACWKLVRYLIAESEHDVASYIEISLRTKHELMLIAAKRGRARNPDLVLGLCGEHGGDPSSVRFCRIAGFDYVSCSPFRVPIARLAAAQASLLARDGPEADAAG